MLAFLSSTWVALHLEFSSTTLGGGALKVEAAHLRRTSVPLMDESDWLKLDSLGAELLRSANRDEIVSEIDAIIGLATRTTSKIPKLKKSLSKRIESRTNTKSGSDRGV